MMASKNKIGKSMSSASLSFPALSSTPERVDASTSVDRVDLTGKTHRRTIAQTNITSIAGAVLSDTLQAASASANTQERWCELCDKSKLQLKSSYIPKDTDNIFVEDIE
jgi:hypothetical protein